MTPIAAGANAIESSPGSTHHVHDDRQTVEQRNPRTTTNIEESLRTSNYINNEMATETGISRSNQSLRVNDEAAADLCGTPGSTDPYRILEEDSEPIIKTHTPFFLRQNTLITFIIVFIALIAALETAFAASRTHNGFGQGSSVSRYLIRYGTSGLFTLTAAFWSRVEYSILRLSPWIRQQTIAGDEHALALDYISMFRLRVPFQALRNGDRHVAAAATISMLLNLLTVLSTSLFVLNNVEVADYPEIVSLQTQFVDLPDRLEGISLIPYYLTQALNDDLPQAARYLTDLSGFNLEYPNGLTDRYAYQAFTTTQPDAHELHVTVDGFSAGLECQEATVRRITGIDNAPSIDGSINASQILVEHDGCHTSIISPFTLGLSNETKITAHIVTQSIIQGFASGKCNSTDIEDRRLMLIYAVVRYTLINQTQNTLANSSDEYDLFEVSDSDAIALVCTPSYDITQVDVIWNITGPPAISRRPNAQSRVLPHIHPWDIMDAIQNSLLGLKAMPGEFLINDTMIDGFPLSIFALISECSKFCSSSLSLLDRTVLQSLFTSYYKKYSAAIIYSSFTNPLQVTTMGTSKRTEVRLLVQTLSSQSITAILSLCLILAVGLIIWPLKQLSSSIEPGSIISVASLVGGISALSLSSKFGDADANFIVKSLHNPQPVAQPVTSFNCQPQQNLNEKDAQTRQIKYYCPLVLRSTCMGALLLYLMGLFISLELMLRKSDANQGLGAIGDVAYLHYAWTALPAGMLALLSLWISSVESETRTWAPFVLLGHEAKDLSILCLDLLRDMAPLTLYKEFRARSFGTLAFSLSALLASFFTIATAALFKTSNFPLSIPVELWTKSTLTSVIPWALQYTFPATSLILESNVSYQNLAYENLIFPGFSLQRFSTANTSQLSDTSTISIQATVPAVRPGLSCRNYPPSALTWSGTYDPDVNPTDPWTDMMKGGCLESIVGNMTSAEGSPAITYFGVASEGGTCNPQLPGTDFAFIWGRNTTSITHSTSSRIWILGCNATIQSVDVLVSFLGPNLAPDKSRPPNPVEASARSVNRFLLGNTTEAQVSIFEMYQFRSQDAWASEPRLASIRPPDNTIMDPFFQQLLTSRYAIPLEYLGDESQIEAVENAIIFQHSIIAAQHISRNFRVNVTLENITGLPNTTLFPKLFSTLNDTIDTGIYTATATDSYGFERVVQDPIATRVLQSLLLSTAVLLLSGWFLRAWRPVLPRAPTSVVSVLALLSGGDVLDHMYKDGQGDCVTMDDAMSRFDEHCRFRLGWGTGESPGAKARFGIWIVRNSTNDTRSNGTSVEGEAGLNDSCSLPIRVSHQGA